jgi:hypothetical protein
MPEIAQLFAVSKDGHTLRAVGDQNGSPITVEERSDRDALGLAVRYLRARFEDQDLLLPAFERKSRLPDSVGGGLERRTVTRR